MHFWRTTGLPGAGDGFFQSFANEPLVGNAAAASTSFHGCEQRLRQTHVDPRRFFFELKLDRTETGQVILGEIGVGDKSLRLAVIPEDREFLEFLFPHSTGSPWHAYSGR